MPSCLFRPPDSTRVAHGRPYDQGDGPADVHLQRDCRLLAAPLAAEAQQAGKVWRVAVLTAGILRSDAPFRALEQRLAELGYVEGRNPVIDFRTAGAQIDRLPALAAELVGGRPDIFVAVSTQGGMAAKDATRTIPIVLTAGDPVVSLLNVEMTGKGFQLPLAFDDVRLPSA